MTKLEQQDSNENIDNSSWVAVSEWIRIDMTQVELDVTKDEVTESVETIESNEFSDQITLDYLLWYLEEYLWDKNFNEFDLDPKVDDLTEEEISLLTDDQICELFYLHLSPEYWTIDEETLSCIGTIVRQILRWYKTYKWIWQTSLWWCISYIKEKEAEYEEKRKWVDHLLSWWLAQGKIDLATFQKKDHREEILARAIGELWPTFLEDLPAESPLVQQIDAYIMTDDDKKWEKDSNIENENEENILDAIHTSYLVTHIGGHIDIKDMVLKKHLLDLYSDPSLPSMEVVEWHEWYIMWDIWKDFLQKTERWKTFLKQSLDFWKKEELPWVYKSLRDSSLIMNVAENETMRTTWLSAVHDFETLDHIFDEDDLDDNMRYIGTVWSVARTVAQQTWDIEVEKSVSHLNTAYEAYLGISKVQEARRTLSRIQALLFAEKEKKPLLAQDIGAKEWAKYRYTIKHEWKIIFKIDDDNRDNKIVLTWEQRRLIWEVYDSNKSYLVSKIKKDVIPVAKTCEETMSSHKKIYEYIWKNNLIQRAWLWWGKLDRMNTAADYTQSHFMNIFEVTDDDIEAGKVQYDFTRQWVEWLKSLPEDKQPPTLETMKHILELPDEAWDVLVIKEHPLVMYSPTIFLTQIPTVCDFSLFPSGQVVAKKYGMTTWWFDKLKKGAFWELAVEVWLILLSAFWVWVLVKGVQVLNAARKARKIVKKTEKVTKAMKRIQKLKNWAVWWVKALAKWATFATFNKTTRMWREMAMNDKSFTDASSDARWIYTTWPDGEKVLKSNKRRWTELFVESAMWGFLFSKSRQRVNWKVYNAFWGNPLAIVPFEWLLFHLVDNLTHPLQEWVIDAWENDGSSFTQWFADHRGENFTLAKFFHTTVTVWSVKIASTTGKKIREAGSWKLLELQHNKLQKEIAKGMQKAWIETTLVNGEVVYRYKKWWKTLTKETMAKNHWPLYKKIMNAFGLQRQLLLAKYTAAKEPANPLDEFLKKNNLKDPNKVKSPEIIINEWIKNAKTPKEKKKREKLKNEYLWHKWIEQVFKQLEKMKETRKKQWIPEEQIPQTIEVIFARSWLNKSAWKKQIKNDLKALWLRKKGISNKVFNELWEIHQMWPVFVTWPIARAKQARLKKLVTDWKLTKDQMRILNDRWFCGKISNWIKSYITNQISAWVWPKAAKVFDKLTVIPRAVMRSHSWRLSLKLKRITELHTSLDKNAKTKKKFEKEKRDNENTILKNNGKLSGALSTNKRKKLTAENITLTERNTKIDEQLVKLKWEKKEMKWELTQFDKEFWFDKKKIKTLYEKEQFFKQMTADARWYDWMLRLWWYKNWYNPLTSQKGTNLQHTYKKSKEILTTKQKKKKEKPKLWESPFEAISLGNRIASVMNYLFLSKESWGAVLIAMRNSTILTTASMVLPWTIADINVAWVEIPIDLPNDIRNHLMSHVLWLFRSFFALAEWMSHGDRSWRYREYQEWSEWSKIVYKTEPTTMELIQWVKVSQTWKNYVIDDPDDPKREEIKAWWRLAELWFFLESTVDPFTDNHISWLGKIDLFWIITGIDRIMGEMWIPFPMNNERMIESNKSPVYVVRFFKNFFSELEKVDPNFPEELKNMESELDNLEKELTAQEKHKRSKEFDNPDSTESVQNNSSQIPIIPDPIVDKNKDQVKDKNKDKIVPIIPKIDQIIPRDTSRNATIKLTEEQKRNKEADNF